MIVYDPIPAISIYRAGSRTAGRDCGFAARLFNRRSLSRIFPLPSLSLNRPRAHVYAQEFIEDLCGFRAVTNMRHPFSPPPVGADASVFRKRFRPRRNVLPRENTRMRLYRPGLILSPDGTWNGSLAHVLSRVNAHARDTRTYVFTSPKGSRTR